MLPVSISDRGNLLISSSHFSLSAEKCYSRSDYYIWSRGQWGYSAVYNSGTFLFLAWNVELWADWTPSIKVAVTSHIDATVIHNSFSIILRGARGGRGMPRASFPACCCVLSQEAAVEGRSSARTGSESSHHQLLIKCSCWGLSVSSSGNPMLKVLLALQPNSGNSSSLGVLTLASTTSFQLRL